MSVPTDEEIRSHIGETVGYYFWHNSDGSPCDGEPMRKGKLLGSLEDLTGEVTTDSVWMVESLTSKMRVTIEADNIYFDVQEDNIIHLDELTMLKEIRDWQENE